MATNLKKTKETALATIDAAITLLDHYPELENSDISIGYSTSLDPIKLTMEIIRKVGGYDAIMRWISDFCTNDKDGKEYGLRMLDPVIKAYLISKLKDIISCSVNPFITDEILRDGIVFNLEEIDIVNILRYSPFDPNVGRYYYFDTGEISVPYTEKKELKNGEIKDVEKQRYENPQTPDYLAKSDDMNAFLWYMINLSNRRHVWKPKKYRKGPEFREDYDTSTKLKKEDGIVTFEFHRRPQDLRDAYGDLYRKQIPYSNVLHVFIGDTRENLPETKLIDGVPYSMGEVVDIEKQIAQKDKDLRKKKALIDKNNEKIDELRNRLYELKKQYELFEITETEYKTQATSINNEIGQLTLQTEQIDDLRNILKREKEYLQQEIANITEQIRNEASIYFPLDAANSRNYYAGKTLFEFNVDFITSLQIFDTKTFVAKLLDSLTGLLSFDLHLSFQQQVVQEEVKNMIKMITETDDVVVSDCFFTFSNADYDAMSRKAELIKAGIPTDNGNPLSDVQFNTEELLSKLNELDKAATQSGGTQTIIENTFKELSKEITEGYKTHKTSNVDAGAQLNTKDQNLIELLLNHLAYTIVMTILSPKVYILLLINFKIIGRETNFDLKGFLSQYEQLIADLVRMIRDQLLDYFVKRLLAIIKDLAAEITVKLNIEQARYYTDLLRKLFDCWQLYKGGDEDWNMDKVDYADILPSDVVVEENKEC